jgi:hypothetical protein
MGDVYEIPVIDKIEVGRESGVSGGLYRCKKNLGYKKRNIFSRSSKRANL